jgi:ABC-type amino acid transport substrate-binding protein
VAQNPSAGLSLVGDPFDLQDYGFALQLGSPLRKELNAALLKLQVSGWTDELEDKWFETPAAGP